MSLQKRELYASPNGDRWYLARYPDSGRVFVHHLPNAPSGGRSTNIELSEFLARGGNAPEQQALVRLIGRLVDEDPTQDNVAAGTETPTDLHNPLSPAD